MERGWVKGKVGESDIHVITFRYNLIYSEDVNGIIMIDMKVKVGMIV